VGDGGEMLERPATVRRARTGVHADVATRLEAVGQPAGAQLGAIGRQQRELERFVARLAAEEADQREQSPHLMAAVRVAQPRVAASPLDVLVATSEARDAPRAEQAGDAVRYPAVAMH